LSLPAVGAFTVKTFTGRGKSGKVDIRVALDKWGRKEWVGKLYPNRTRERDFLGEYTKLFQTIELNAVFYSIPSQQLILSWKDMIASHHQEQFLFMPKISRTISHIKRLQDVERPTTEFLDAVRLFGENLGPIFLQLGDNFPPKNLELLENFVKALPTDLRFFVELRHSEWFSDRENRKGIFALLKKYNIGAIITDTPGRRDCVHMELTIPEVYIRFNGLGPKFREMDFQRIDAWADRLKSWADVGLQKAYFSISQKDVTDSPALAQYAILAFNSKLDAGIPTIDWKDDAPVTNLPPISAEEFFNREQNALKARLGMKLQKDEDS